LYRKIVDFHAHAFHDKIAEKAAKNLTEYYDIPLAGNGMFRYLLESMQENKIDKLVIHATATKPEQVPVINQYVSGLIGDNIIGFGTLHPDYADWKSELDKFPALGLHGIKFHPIFQGFNIDDESMFPIYEALEGKYPMLIHVGDKNSDGATPRRLARVLDKFPKLVTIAAHMGGFSEWEAAREYIIGRENVYVDTSSSIRFMEPEEATELVYAHGVDRVLFGTDYPLSLHVPELAVFDKLELTEEEKEQILWKNAYRLLGLSE